MSITPVSDIPISVDYTGRDYYSLRETLIQRIQDRIPEWTASDPADFGVALVEAFAYLGDLIAFYIDRVANESLIQTATQRDSILNIAKNYGYIPAGYRQATVDITFANSSDTAITIPAGTELNNDYDGDSILDGFKIIVSYVYRITSKLGDDTTLGSSRISIWYQRAVYETDQFDTTQVYPLNCTLYVGLDGKLTSKQPTENHPGIAMCTGVPSSTQGTLEFVLL